MISMMAALSSCNRSWYWISGWDWSWRTASWDKTWGHHQWFQTCTRALYFFSFTCVGFFECTRCYRGAASSVLVNLQFLGRCWPALSARRGCSRGNLRSTFKTQFHSNQVGSFLPSGSCFMPSSVLSDVGWEKWAPFLCVLWATCSGVEWWGELFRDLHNWWTICSLTTPLCRDAQTICFNLKSYSW